MDDLTYQPVKHDHKEYLRKAMESREFREGYEALEPKYALIRELLEARKNSGMTQEKRGGRTFQSAILFFLIR